MNKHIKVLGLFHVAYGVIGLGSLYGMLFLTSRVGHLMGHWHAYSYYNGYMGVESFQILKVIAFHLAALVALLGLGSVIAGCGLLGHKNWARVLVLILGIIALFNIPFGTALGVYTLWVVLKPETQELLAS